MISESVSEWSCDAFGDELFLQFEIVFDDAVMDDDDVAGSADMGMGVAGVGLAVGGPAGVPDAELAGEGVVLHDFEEPVEFAGVAPDFDMAVFEDGNPG